MSALYRLQITKEEPIRFISHLDFMRTVERALRRAQLPLAYSEGFNPHLKVSYASALAVGVTSKAEYLDVELKEPLDVESVKVKITQALPVGIELCYIQERTGKTKKLAAIVNWATYEIKLPKVSGLTSSQLEEAIQQFNQAEVIQYLKKNPKGEKVINLKEFVLKPIELWSSSNEWCISLPILQGNQGSVKPLEVLTALREMAGLSLSLDQAKIERTGLYCRQEGKEFTPFEV